MTLSEDFQERFHAPITTQIAESARLSRESILLVLGSRSPRRRQLLQEAGFEFIARASDEGVEESWSDATLAPRELALALAGRKAENVARGVASDASFDFRGRPSALVVACDSLAECAGEVMGKPLDAADAERMLRKLSGSRHCVHTGLVVQSIDARSRETRLRVARAEMSTLVMEPLSEARLRSYLASGLWEGKAGAFGYQDGNDWLRLESGSESNVVGLPMEALAETIVALVAEDERKRAKENS